MLKSIRGVTGVKAISFAEIKYTSLSYACFTLGQNVTFSGTIPEIRERSRWWN